MKSGPVQYTRRKLAVSGFCATNSSNDHCRGQMGGDNRKELYDATGQVWLELFGEHVHVGEYVNRNS